MYDSLMTSCSEIAFLQGTGQIIPSAIFSWCYAKVRDTGAWSGGSQGLAVSWNALGGRTACIHRDNQTGSINRRLRRKFILRAWHWVPGTMARWSLAEEWDQALHPDRPAYFPELEPPSNYWCHDSRMGVRSGLTWLTHPIVLGSGFLDEINLLLADSGSCCPATPLCLGQVTVAMDPIVCCAWYGFSSTRVRGNIYLYLLWRILYDMLIDTA